MQTRPGARLAQRHQEVRFLCIRIPAHAHNREPPASPAPTLARTGEQENGCLRAFLLSLCSAQLRTKQTWIQGFDQGCGW
jgi:hypothetical protein